MPAKITKQAVIKAIAETQIGDQVLEVLCREFGIYTEDVVILTFLGGPTDWCDGVSHPIDHGGRYERSRMGRGRITSYNSRKHMVVGNFKDHSGHAFIMIASPESDE